LTNGGDLFGRDRNVTCCENIFKLFQGAQLSGSSVFVTFDLFVNDGWGFFGLNLGNSFSPFMLGPFGVHFGPAVFHNATFQLAVSGHFG